MTGIARRKGRLDDQRHKDLDLDMLEPMHQRGDDEVAQHLRQAAGDRDDADLNGVFGDNVQRLQRQKRLQGETDHARDEDEGKKQCDAGTSRSRPMGGKTGSRMHSRLQGSPRSR